MTDTSVGLPAGNRIQVLVRLTVRNFPALERFESQAVAIMREYGGEMLAAFEPEGCAEQTGTEIHLLQFPDIASFDLYRDDARLQALAGLREQAIAETCVTVSRRIKHY